MKIELPEGFDSLTNIDRFHVLQGMLRRSGYELAGLTFPGNVQVTTGMCGNNWLPIVRPIASTQDVVLPPPNPSTQGGGSSAGDESLDELQVGPTWLPTNEELAFYEASSFGDGD